MTSTLRCLQFFLLIQIGTPLFSQVVIGTPTLVDTSSKELDWDPVSQYPHPEHSFKNDPWTMTAKALAKTKQSNIDVNKSEPFTSCNSTDLALIKALGIKAFKVAQSECYLATSKNNDDVDMITNSYQSLVPFEIRQTPYVWAIVVKLTNPNEITDIEKLIGMDLSKYKAKFESIHEPAKLGYEYQLRGDGLSPYLADAIVFRTSDSIVISGSKIMGDIPFPVSNSVGSNRTWLLEWTGASRTVYRLRN